MRHTIVAHTGSRAKPGRGLAEALFRGDRRRGKIEIGGEET